MAKGNDALRRRAAGRIPRQRTAHLLQKRPGGKEPKNFPNSYYRPAPAYYSIGPDTDPATAVLVDYTGKPVNGTASSNETSSSSTPGNHHAARFLHAGDHHTACDQQRTGNHYAARNGAAGQIPLRNSRPPQRMGRWSPTVPDSGAENLGRCAAGPGSAHHTRRLIPYGVT